MKLNYDCIRDILLLMEERKLNDYLYFKDAVTSLENYSHDDITYNVLKLKEAGFISVVSKDNNITKLIDISFDGHQFLEDIRLPSNWDKLKNVGTAVGSTSIKALSFIATEIVKALIAQQINGF